MQIITVLLSMSVFNIAYKKSGWQNKWSVGALLSSNIICVSNDRIKWRMYCAFISSAIMQGHHSIRIQTFRIAVKKIEKESTGKENEADRDRNIIRSMNN